MAKTIFEEGPSAGAMRQRNPDNFNPGIQNLRYRVDTTVYIYSVAKRPFIVSQTLFPRLELKGCVNGERWVLAAAISDPVPQASPDLERGGARVDYHDGWKVAIGLLNPMNVGDDPWAQTSGALSEGTNLIERGLWPSLNKEPKESEIRRAENLRDRRYRSLCNDAIRLAATSRRGLQDFLVQHEDVHEAMDALGLDADWHRKNVVTRPCPNCGDAIPPSVAFHQSSAGVLCIIDPQRAMIAGAIDKARFEELAALRA